MNSRIILFAALLTIGLTFSCNKKDAHTTIAQNVPTTPIEDKMKKAGSVDSVELETAQIYNKYSHRNRGDIEEWLKQFHGMDHDSDGNYAQSDKVLENTPGIVKKEHIDTIYDNIDSTFFLLSLGMYYEESYPARRIMKRVEEAVDTTLIEEISYYYNKGKLKRLRNSNIPHSTMEMFQFGTRIFNLICKSNRPNAPKKAYQKILDGRICIVSHKIYEDKNIVTYMIESSVNYNGSCGCPSSTNYYSYYKKNGRLMTVKDIIKKIPKNDLCKKLKEQHKIETVLKGHMANNSSITGEKLLQVVDGCARIKDGYLLYYYPYNISYGADGQFNLIID